LYLIQDIKWRTNKRVPIDPNFLHSARKGVEEFKESILGKIFGRDSSDEDSVGLDRFCMCMLDQVLLASDNKMTHFLSDMVEDPDYRI
jgi:hypothetical protein